MKKFWPFPTLVLSFLLANFVISQVPPENEVDICSLLTDQEVIELIGDLSEATVETELPEGTSMRQCMWTGQDYAGLALQLGDASNLDTIEALSEFLSNEAYGVTAHPLEDLAYPVVVQLTVSDANAEETVIAIVVDSGDVWVSLVPMLEIFEASTEFNLLRKLATKAVENLINQR